MDWSFLREISLLLLLYLALHHLTSLLLPTKRAHVAQLPPGPRGYPVVGALPLLRQAPHEALARLAKQYGPLMHLKMGSQGVVVASTPDAARLLLKTHGASFLDRPVDTAPTLLAYGAQDLVFAAYGPKWKLLRKVCSLGFLGPQALADWADVRRAEMGRMVRAMLAASRLNEPVEVPELLFCAMVNMIGKVVVGSRVLSDASPEAAREFKEMVVELMTTAGLPNVSDYVPAVAWLDLQGLGRKMRRLRARLDAVWSRMVAYHEAASGRPKGQLDLLDRLIACRENGVEHVTDVNIKALLNDLFTAGTDTSSSTIQWALAEMLLNPAILQRAHAEMDAVVGRDRLLQESDIPRLPYLRAICKESFRKHPSTPLNLPHVSTEPCNVQGYHVPKGTRLIVNIWAIGRDPDVWPGPMKFDPDRFMTEEGMKIQPTGNHFELIPFGAGRRMCAGARMGVVLVQYILGTLVHAFDWEMPAGAVMDMEEVFGLALQKAVPVTAVVRPRLAASAYE